MKLARLRIYSCCALLVLFSYSALPQTPASNSAPSLSEKLTYLVEWRLINAGTATVETARDAAGRGYNLNVHIESAGLVSRLYRVIDSYKVAASERFCLSSATLDAQEGKKHVLSKATVDGAQHRLTFDERDLVANKSEKKVLDVAACTFEITGALASLRRLNLEPGKSIVIPITDGKKFTQARVTAQSREKLTVGGKSYAVTRYEAFLFDGVLYRRKGRLLIWMSDEGDHVPVQFRILLGFPIGTVTVSLQKQER